jgi:hypothetical protein
MKSDCASPYKKWIQQKQKPAVWNFTLLQEQVQTAGLVTQEKVIWAF